MSSTDQHKLLINFTFLLGKHTVVTCTLAARGPQTALQSSAKKKNSKCKQIFFVYLLQRYTRCERKKAYKNSMAYKDWEFLNIVC